MITNITYNQIIEASRNFAIAHYKLKGSFGNGLLSDKVLHDQLGRFQYYLMYMEDLEMSVEKNLSTFGFRVSFSAPETTLKNQSTDLPSTNFNEIKSDAIKLCMDFLAYWMTATDNDYPTLYVEPNAGIHVYQDLTPDRLAGAYIDIRFKQAFDANSCAIPMSGVGSASNTCDPVFIYENNILVATVASGGEYRYTSGSASIDIAVNGTPFYSGVSTNQDLPVKDSTGSNNVGSKVGNEFHIGDTQVILKNTANETLSTQNFYAESQANEMVADNVTSDFNGVTILQETPSGQNKSFSVVDSNEYPIGSVNSDLPNSTKILVSDVTQTLNGAAITNNKAETSKAITIRYANNDPVTVTTITDTEAVFIGEVPDVVTPLNTSNPFKTGQTNSYVENDDGYLKRGNGVDFYTLSHNNYFGNTNRFTDDAGGQTYTSGWVIDWATWNQITGSFIMWYKTPQAGATWTNALDGQPYNVGGFADCMLPNATEIGLLYNFDLASALNYAPFNYTVAGTASNLWTTTTVPSAPTTAIAFQGLVVEAARAKTLVITFFVMRYGNISEL